MDAKVHYSLAIEGMTCAACSSRLEKILRAQTGVAEASVNLASERASISGTQDLTLDSIVNAVKRAGFDVPVRTIDLTVQGMSCASCVTRAEKALCAAPGVESAEVNLATESARVRTRLDADPEPLLHALERAGFQGALRGNDNTERELTLKKRQHWQLFSLWASVILSLPLLFPMLTGLFGVQWMLPGWVQWILATPVQFVFGARFYRSAWPALRSGSGNMDLLVALGTSAAYGLSLYLLFTATMPHLYFEASATVITLVQLGKWLEGRARQRTASAIHALQELRPENARIRNEAGEEQEVPISGLHIGDIVLVRAGERIPVDGVLVEGQTSVDESLLTGESLPVSKTRDDTVIAGSINADGFIAIRTTATGAQTALARIIELVENAQAVKPPIQRQVDRVAAIFVPVVVAIAILTLLAWGLFGGNWEHALLNAVAVLVIACPCALGLATPAAIMAGTGAAARHGILIRDSEALEQAQHLRAVAFDKTGTLTQGKPVLVALEPRLPKELLSPGAPTQFGAAGLGYAVSTGQRQFLLARAAALQAGSEHPLAHAVLSAAQDLPLPATSDIKVHPGRGIEGNINGRRYALGSQRWMAELGLDEAALSDQASAYQAHGHTVSWLVDITEHPIRLALLAFGDIVRPQAPASVTRLSAHGIHPVLLTGDHKASALAVANQVGITDIRAEVLPADKAGVIEELRREYGCVAMIGDGINDAPALAASDVGIAMGSGTDVAMNTAGITLMRPDPRLVLDAIDISQQTSRKIRQNLFWATIYNLVGIPLAAAGLLNPIIAGAAMAFSSVSVVSNALLLTRWRPTSSPMEHGK